MADINPEDWETHLKEALDDLPIKRKVMSRQERYHEGRHPKVWLNKRLRKQFKNMADHMVDNLCGIAIEKALSRLRVESFQVEDTGVKTETEGNESGQEKAANLLFEDSGALLAQVDAMRDGLRFGEGYLYEQRGEDGEPDTSTHVDPRWVYWPCGQDPINPDYAVILIPDYEDECWRATFLYETSYVRVKGPELDDTQRFPTSTQNFEIDEEDGEGEHGFDKVPLVRFTDRPYSLPVSRLQDLIPSQDRINKLTANKMVIAEGLAYPQRLLLTEQEVSKDIMAPRPDNTIVIHPGNTSDGGVATSIKEFSAAPLENYDRAIYEEKRSFYIKAAMPLHGLNGDPSASGAAREADEGDFIEFLLGFQEYMDVSWNYWLDLHGLQARPQWRDVRPRGDSIRIENVKKATEAGVSLRSALMEYGGWPKEAVDAMFSEPEEVEKRENAKKATENLPDPNQEKASAVIVERPKNGKSKG